MPIIRNFNCGCGQLHTSEESDAIAHAKTTGHEVHGTIRITTVSRVQRTQTSPIHGHFEKKHFVSDRKIRRQRKVNNG